MGILRHDIWKQRSRLAGFRGKVYVDVAKASDFHHDTFVNGHFLRCRLVSNFKPRLVIIQCFIFLCLNQLMGSRYLLRPLYGPFTARFSICYFDIHHRLSGKPGFQSASPNVDDSSSNYRISIHNSVCWVS